MQPLFLESSVGVWVGEWVFARSGRVGGALLLPGSFRLDVCQQTSRLGRPGRGVGGGGWTAESLWKLFC